MALSIFFSISFILLYCTLLNLFLSNILFNKTMLNYYRSFTVNNSIFWPKIDWIGSDFYVWSLQIIFLLPLYIKILPNKILFPSYFIILLFEILKSTNVVMNYTDAKIKVGEATNEETFTYEDKENWRYIYKGLLLVAYMLKNGSEQVVTSSREHVYD